MSSSPLSQLTSPHKAIDVGEIGGGKCVEGGVFNVFACRDKSRITNSLLFDNRSVKPLTGLNLFSLY